MIPIILPMKRRRKKNEGVVLRVLNAPVEEAKIDFVIGAMGDVLKHTEPRSCYHLEDVFDNLEDSARVGLIHNIDHDTLNFGAVAWVPIDVSASNNMPLKISAHRRDPMAWWRLTDLFALCGPIMTVFLVMQVLSSVATTWFVMGFADVDHRLLVGMLILANLVIDAVILAYHRGRHYKELARPVVLTALVTILPGSLLMLWIHTKGLF